MTATTRSINEAAESWVSSMLELLGQIPIPVGAAQTPGRLSEDLRQFEALADHLRMLLSTRPANSWEAYHWSLNFSFFLSQLLRRSEQLFNHLAEYPDACQLRVSPTLFADLFLFMRLTRHLPNYY